MEHKLIPEQALWPSKTAAVRPRGSHRPNPSIPLNPQDCVGGRALGFSHRLLSWSASQWLQAADTSIGNPIKCTQMGLRTLGIKCMDVKLKFTSIKLSITKYLMVHQCKSIGCGAEHHHRSRSTEQRVAVVHNLLFLSRMCVVYLLSKGFLARSYNLESQCLHLRAKLI